MLPTICAVLLPLASVIGFVCEVLVVKAKLQEILSSHLMTDENWNAFKREFIKPHGNFYNSVIENFPELKKSNLKIIMLQKLDLNNYEMANVLGVTIDAIKKSKQRLKKKLGDRYELLFEIR